MQLGFIVTTVNQLKVENTFLAWKLWRFTYILFNGNALYGKISRLTNICYAIQQPIKDKKHIIMIGIEKCFELKSF